MNQWQQRTDQTGMDIHFGDIHLNGILQNLHVIHRHYVAKNRGALHITPLIGYNYSVKSLNDNPAPGTA